MVAAVSVVILTGNLLTGGFVASAAAQAAVATHSPNLAPTADEKAFLQVALTVMAVDHLIDRCSRRTPLSSLDAAQLATWQKDHRVGDIRAEVTRRQGIEPWRTWLPQARTAAESSVDKMDMEPCKAMMAATRVPSAQFAKSAPDVLASLGAAPAAGGPATAAVQPTPPPAPAAAPAPAVSPSTPVATTGSTTSASARAIVDQIDSFGFDSAAAMGVGGFITTRIYPVVLFKNGDVLTDVEGLNFPGGLDAHRRAKPRDWGKWRRTGTTIEITGSKGWEKLSFSKTYSSLPADFRLNGLYRHLGGVGNVGVGGTDAVSVVTDYRFFPDGHVTRGGATGAQSTAGDFSTVVSTTPPNRRGTYRIDGITLNIKYDDGRQESLIIVTDPADPKGVIWLDGTGYVQRNR